MSPVFAHGQLRLYLLSLLDEAPRHGYEVIRALEDRFGGLYSPSAGSVYPRLSRLEDEGLVARSDEGRTAVYSITDAGRSELRDRADDVAALQRDLDDSVRRLAADVRERVRADARDLRNELRDAAREARRTAVGVGAGGGEDRPDSRATVREAEDLVRTFAAETRADLRRHGLDAEGLAELRTLLDGVRRQVRDLLRGSR
jgi:DNA-binding PadR family transcriptional regulator